jgi:hydrogenase-4 component E
MKYNLLAWVSLAIVICNLSLLATGRLTAMIRGVAAQGALLSILPLLLPNPAQKTHVIVLVVLTIAIKGIFIPGFLFKAIRNVRTAREIDPVVGNSLSILCGILAAGVSFFVLRKVPFYSMVVSPFHASTAMTTAFIGLFLIITRRNVVSQIIGYIVFENAGFILGVSIAAFQPFFIEMGVLLDLLVGVFIMAMAVKYVRTEHDTISIRPLERLTQ